MRVSSVTVCSDRVDVIVCVDDDRMRTSMDGAVVTRALEVLPGLAAHRCSSGLPGGFVEEMHDTEVPHLFEHMVLELMAKAGSPRDLNGETVWDFKREGHGVFRVTVEYDVDLVALGAIKTARGLMGYVLEGGDRPDVSAEVARLAALHDWPAAIAS